MWSVVAERSVVTSLAGGVLGTVDGSGSTARFRSPTGLAADASGNVFVADLSNQRIRKMSPDGGTNSRIGSEQLDCARAVATLAMSKTHSSVLFLSSPLPFSTLPASSFIPYSLLYFPQCWCVPCVLCA